MAVGDSVRWTRLHAIPTEDAARIVDVEYLSVALACTDALLRCVLSRFDVDALCRACRSAEKASHALFQPVLIPLKYMQAPVANLEVNGFIRVILGDGGPKQVPQRNRKAFRQGHCSLGDLAQKP